MKIVCSPINWSPIKLVHTKHIEECVIRLAWNMCILILVWVFVRIIQLVERMIYWFHVFLFFSSFSWVQQFNSNGEILLYWLLAMGVGRIYIYLYIDCVCSPECKMIEMNCILFRVFSLCLSMFQLCGRKWICLYIHSCNKYIK